MKMIILVMLTMLAFDSLAQGDNVLVSIVQSNLVYHSLDDNQVKTIPLSSTILENEVVRSIDYNPACKTVCSDSLNSIC